MEMIQQYKQELDDIFKKDLDVLDRQEEIYQFTDALRDLWLKNSTLRFGQFYYWLKYQVTADNSNDGFYVEDIELFKEIIKQLNEGENE